jgi:hypothetical protein
MEFYELLFIHIGDSGFVPDGQVRQNLVDSQFDCRREFLFEQLHNGTPGPLFSAPEEFLTLFRVGRVVSAANAGTVCRVCALSSLNNHASSKYGKKLPEYWIRFYLYTAFSCLFSTE